MRSQSNKVLINVMLYEFIFDWDGDHEVKITRGYRGVVLLSLQGVGTNDIDSSHGGLYFSMMSYRNFRS